jgi:hypothetical protein
MSQPRPRPANFQTVRLGRGKHASPAEGACVMELASMLAGEPFSDRPVSVSPAIAAFLRAYNDSLDDRRRQDLYGVATQVLGTRSTPEVEQRRIRHWTNWAARRRAKRSRWARVYWRVRHGRHLSYDTDVAAFLAVKSIGRHTDESHAEVLRLIGELCAIGGEDRSPRVQGNGGFPRAGSAASRRAPAADADLPVPTPQAAYRRPGSKALT